MLPLPAHFDPGRVADVWRVRYEERAADAERWRAEHELRPGVEDGFRLCLLLIDVQNTFCTPGFELFVGGQSGTGAVDDNVRLCEFLYRNLDAITQIVATLDTHQAFQIFHAAWLVDDDGRHPDPYTTVTAQDVAAGRWHVDPAAGNSAGVDPASAERHLAHYTQSLERGGKYALTIWPYHAMLGGIGHALVSAVEEAVFFHGAARRSQARLEIKGWSPLTEHYSAIGPEVTTDADGRPIAEPNRALVDLLASFDAIVVAGQAKSHCVAWTVEDLLVAEPALANRVYLLEDCSSAVVVPGVVDYTDDADRAYARFADAGMHLVRSTEPVQTWPGVTSALATPSG